MPTPDSSPTRRLAAIVFTDIVGFTKLSAQDETKAAELIKRQRALLTPIIQTHDGMLLKEMGDGLLLSFYSATSAVECAIEIQKIANTIDDLNLRIGIHQGEVIIDGKDIIGDDVNVAARIEPFSAPGGVAISNAVQQDIASNASFKTKLVGKPKLKGVQQDITIYCIISHGLPETKLSEVSAKLEKKTPIWYFVVPALLLIVITTYFLIPKKPSVVSVAVMYMDIRGNEEDQYLETITEDLIFDLSSALPGQLKVSESAAVKKLKNTDLEIAEIGKRLDVKYIFKSSLQRYGDGFNLRCKLIEANTGTDKFINKWFIQSNGLQSIVSVLVDNIISGLDLTVTGGIAKIEYDPEAYQLYLKAKDQYARSDDYEKDKKAMDLMKDAIALDDKLVTAQLRLGLMYYENGEYEEAGKLYEQSLNKSKQLEDNTNIAESLRKQGQLFRKQRQYDLSLEKFNEALSIFTVMNDKSNMAKAMNSIAILYYRTKRLDEALEYWLQAYNTAKGFDDKLKISKYVNNIGIWYWKDYDYSKAIDYYNESLLIKEELGDTRNYGKTLNNMGQAYYDMGDFSSSIEYFNQSIELKEKLNDKKGLQATLLNLGEAYFDNDDYDHALSHFRKSLNIARAFGVIYDISDRYTAIGMTHFNLANYDSATYYLTMADSIYIEYPTNRLTILSWLAITSIKDGNTQRAKTYVNELEEIFSSNDPLKEDIIKLNWNMYRVHQLLGKTKAAKEYLENSYLELKYRSKNIKDKKDREKYLSVKLNQDIAAAWVAL
jgi:class 3 adenylate cyclase/tetratricopeptide (TPR) repeat protein/TolB-like protein